jgi:hypothetical protein
MKVTRNDYFTYITDGDSEITFRAKDQVWNCSYNGINYAIHVSGPNAQPAYAGQYNAFAKKHLLTLGGGKAASGMSNFLSVAEGIREDTRVSSSDKKGFERTVLGKLSGIHTKRQHGTMYSSYGDRQEKHDEMSASSQAQYQVEALGGRSQDESTPLTMVLCDLLSPQDLMEAFAKAIATERKRAPAGAGAALTGPGNHGVPVIFDTQCVFQHDSRTNTFQKGDRIRVTIYLQACSATDVVAHVVHCHGI